PELLLNGLAAFVVEGCAAGVPVLKRAVSAFRSTDVTDEEALRSWRGPHAGALVWDYESMDVVSARQIKIARDAGALIELAMSLSMHTYVHLFSGEFAAAGSVATAVPSMWRA